MTLSERASVATSVKVGARPCVRGKFLFVGDEKFYVRGVTYGTFSPDADGHQYPEPAMVERDFAQMAANGINAIRTYTVPPR
jgi:beta-galactosidase/beta-glucuronidase